MQGKSGRLILFLVLYAIMLGLFYSTMKPGQQAPPPTPETFARLRTQAEQLETQAREGEVTLSRTDRERTYQEAIRQYEQIVRLAGRKDDAIDARIQIARLHEEMAKLGFRGHLDQAEQTYKDLAKQFANRTARVRINGEFQNVEVGQWASEKVAAVQRQRALEARHSFLYRLLDFLVMLTGRIPSFSYWFALFLLTIVIKVLLYPFSKRQFQSMQDMARVAPLIKEAQEKLKGRPAEEIHRRTMAIYKENNVSFTAGCLPLIIQMAALIPLYQMVRVYEYEFRKGTFLWIGSSFSYQHPQWLARNLSEFDIPLCLLYIISFYLTSKITPMAMSADPVQRQQQKIMTIMMPLIFGWMMFAWRFPAAFIFYWLVLNIVSTIQQYRIIKQYQPAPVTGSVGTPPPSSGDGAVPPRDDDRTPPAGGGNGRRAEKEVTVAAKSPAVKTPASSSRSRKRKRPRGARA